jgi:hypothetical protein
MATKPGKWAFLKGTYATLPIEPNQQALLDAIWNTLSDPADEFSTLVKDLSNQDLCEWYNARRMKKEELEKQVSQLENEIFAATRLYIDRFEEDGITKQAFTNGIEIAIQEEPYPFVTDKQKLKAWIKSTGLEDLLTLNSQTMASLVKERLSGKVNEPLPDGVDVFMKSKLIRRGSAKGE